LATATRNPGSKPRAECTRLDTHVYRISARNLFYEVELLASNSMHSEFPVSIKTKNAVFPDSRTAKLFFLG
jgi:hypothetical protein